MSKFVIRGSKPLQGEVQIGGAKNAALPILAATLLADSPSLIKNVPHLLDVETMFSVLESLGCKVEKVGEHAYRISPALYNTSEAPYELIRKMRASFLVTGPLIARHGRAQVPLWRVCYWFSPY